MGFVAWIVFGLIAGAIAKMIMPGRDPSGMIVTMTGSMVMIVLSTNWHAYLGVFLIAAIVGVCALKYMNNVLQDAMLSVLADMTEEARQMKAIMAAAPKRD